MTIIARGDEQSVFDYRNEPKPAKPYKTFRELILATRYIYADAAEISRADDGGCIYSRRANQLGCGIGCHFPNEITVNWDAPIDPIGDIVIGTGITELFQRIRGIETEFSRVMDMDVITIEQLQILQEAHDNSQTAADFRSKLDMYLAVGAEEDLYW